MKNIKTLLIILAAALLFTACEKDETPALLSISGEVAQQDALSPALTTPLEGITVYLLNSPFTIDTTALWFTKTDVLDSLKTDANGIYKFDNLQVGNYTVVPVDTVVGYLFDCSENADPNTISAGNSQTEYTVNFTTREMVAENSAEKVSLRFKNSGFFDHNDIVVYREKRQRFLHYWWSNWNLKQVGCIFSKDMNATNSLSIQTKDTSSEEFRGGLTIKFLCEAPSGSQNPYPRELEIRQVDYSTATYNFNVKWNGYTSITITQE